jgi:hypothetical protein
MMLFILGACVGNSAEWPGQDFVGAKYMESPLGEGVAPDSDPLIRFDAFDCTTLVETVLANADQGKLNQIRYADGEIGFQTRNHFIESDWLRNNSSRVENVSAKYAKTDVRCVTIDKKSWMKKVHDIDVNFEPEDVEIEYIPYENLGEFVPDAPMIVLFVTDNPELRDKIGTDLAVVHMGFWLPNGMLRHASSSQGAVVDVDMNQYVQMRMQDKTNLGIALVEIKK